MYRLCSSLLMFFVLVVSKAQSGQALRGKRSDDRSPLEAVVSTLSQQLSQQTAQLTALQHTVSQQQQQLQQQRDKLSLHVAFHARLKTEVHINNDQTVKFDLVLFSQGAAYEPATGIFTAPASGLYVFLFSTRGNGDAQTASVYLAVKGQVKVFLDVWNRMSSAHGVFHLSKGDTVRVAGNGDGKFLYSYDSTFTGFLLSPDW